MANLVKKISAIFKPREEVSYQIRSDEQGFTLFKNHVEEISRICWVEVARITTHKVDCFAYDTIWLSFEITDTDLTLKVSEADEGFGDFMKKMNKAFPTINPEWYADVMQPPFAENFTVLFERKTL